jgi:hypothetical protein
VPTIILTEEQAEQGRPILELQKARETGCFARSTGERTVELSFERLEWSKAVSICGKIKKFATELPAVPPSPLFGTSPDKTRRIRQGLTYGDAHCQPDPRYCEGLSGHQGSNRPPQSQETHMNCTVFDLVVAFINVILIVVNSRNLIMIRRNLKDSEWLRLRALKNLNESIDILLRSTGRKDENSSNRFLTDK